MSPSFRKKLTTVLDLDALRLASDPVPLSLWGSHTFAGDVTELKCSLHNRSRL